MNRIAKIGEDYDEKGIITLVLIIISLLRNCKFQPSIVKKFFKMVKKIFRKQKTTH